MNFNVMKLSNGIFTNLTILDNTSETENINDSILPIEWNSNTLFNCDFTTIYGGNPAGYNVDNIKYIQIKRQKLGDVDWITLVKLPVTEVSDLEIEHHDYFNQNGVVYNYALVEIDNSGNESTYQTATIQSCFNDTFIVDEQISYNLTSGTSYDAYQRNQQTGIYETFGRQFPIVVMNSKLDYYSMTTSAYLIQNNKTNDFDYISQKEYLQEFAKFLNNKKSKILKDYNGNIWLIAINGSPNISPIAELGNSIAKVSFNWVEIGHADKEKDLTSARLLPVKPIYSQVN